jgi:hypothetical protein
MDEKPTFCMGLLNSSMGGGLGVRTYKFAEQISLFRRKMLAPRLFVWYNLLLAHPCSAMDAGSYVHKEVKGIEQVRTDVHHRHPA